VVWTGLICLRIGPVEGSCENGNEPSGSIKVGKFLSSCATGGLLRRAHFHGICWLVGCNLRSPLCTSRLNRKERNTEETRKTA
jgi:hypothetical protein